MTRLGVAACLAMAMTACGSKSPTTPSPTTPGPPTPGRTATVTLSGRILEVLPDGTRRPISARQVAIEVEVDSPKDPQRGGWVPVGADGRYHLSGVPDGRFVKISAVDLIRPPSYRFCGTNTITRGDTELDVPLFLSGAAVPTPTLSGQVFTMIQGKSVPLAGADVYYQSRGYGPDMVEGTDADGRYSLCGVPATPGTLYMVCDNDQTIYRQAVDIRADAIIDIDATTFYRCLLLGTPSGS